MTRPNPSVRVPLTTRPRRHAPAVATAAIAAIVAGAALAGPVAASAAPAAPVVTRAALDPALVAGRGADVPFLEQEAENAATNGAVIGPTAPRTRCRRGVRPHRGAADAGEYVEFTLPRAANAITVRYSIPDAPNGGGITAPLEVTVTAERARTMTLTSSTRGSTTSTRSRTTRTRTCCTPTGGSPSAAACRRPPRRRWSIASRSGRCTSTTSSACCSEPTYRPVTRSG